MKPNEKHSENRDLLKVAARAARFAAGPTPSPQNGKTDYKGGAKTLIGQPVTPTRHCDLPARSRSFASAKAGRSEAIQKASIWPDTGLLHRYTPRNDAAAGLVPWWFNRSGEIQIYVRTEGQRKIFMQQRVTRQKSLTRHYPACPGNPYQPQARASIKEQRYG